MVRCSVMSQDGRKQKEKKKKRAQLHLHLKSLMTATMTTGCRG